MAIKRSFILSTGIGVSADNLFVVNNTNSVSSTTGSIVLSGGIGIGQSASISGRLQMFNGANYTSFVSSASGNTVYTLPATSPATGSSVLQSTSAGVLSWVPMTATGGAASGNTAQNIVVNNAGNASAFHPILFTPSPLSAGSAVSSDGTISFNPSTEILNVSGLAITNTTASTSTSNGALQVAGGVGISGRLSFNQASFGTTGIATNPTMAMIGQTGDPIFMTVLEDNSIAFEGAQGQLFSITPNLSTGYIYSVNDITGIPLIRANANANVTANEYAGNFGIGLTNPGYKLHVLGSVGFTSTTASTSTTTGALVVTGGVGIGQTLFTSSSYANSLSGVVLNNGVVTSGSWAGSLITGLYGGTGFNSYTKGDILVGAGTTLIKHAVGSQNQILIADLFSGSGLSWAAFANPTYGSFYSTSSQPVAGAGATTLATFNSTYESNRVSIIGGSGTSSRIQIQDSGPYSLTFSAQINLTSGTQPKVGDFWFRINGQDVPQSNTQTTISGKDFQTVITINFVYTFATNDYFEIAFSSNDSNFRIEALSGLTNPPRPNIPSIILSVLPVTHIVGESGAGISGILSLNGSTASQQYFLTGTSGTGFNIQTASGNHTFNIPIAGSGATGLVTGIAQTFEGSKTFSASTIISSSTASTTTTTGALIVSGGVGIGGSIFGGSTISAADNIEIRSGKELRLNNSGNTFYTGIKAGANTSNTTYTFPTAFPATGTSVLQSDTSGTLSWVGSIGTATTAANINVVSATTSASHPVLFTPATGTASGAAVSSEPTFVYNPSTDILSVSGLAITSGTASTSSTTGALIVTGGVGIGGSLHVGTSRNTLYTVTPIAGFAASIPSTASVEILNSNSLGYTRLNLTNNNGNYVSFSLNGSGVANPNRAAIESSANLLIAAETNILHISTSGEHIFDSGGYCLRIGGSGVSVLLTEPSTSSSTGALTVAGGAGIAKTSYFGQSVFIQGTTASGSTTTGALVVSGGAGIAGSVSVGGRLQLFNGANYTAFVSSATGNTVYLLPATSPATGSSVLQSTSAGVLSWVPMTAGAASGNTAQNIVVNTAGNANAFHPILFTPSSLSAGSAVSSDSTISFNPSTEILNVSGLAITSGTASTNTTTGALVVRGGLGVTGQLSFAQASFGFTGITTNPIMSFIGATSSSPITLTVLTDNSLNFEGSQGSVFSIDSNLSSGEIFSVSDISGLPIISASAGQTVNINEFGGFTQIGNGSINSSSTTTGSLVVAGGMGVTGNANIGGTVRITNTTASTTSSSGALTVSGGVGIGLSASIGGRLQLFNGANYTAFVSSATGNTVYTLPATSPATGTSVLVSTSAGVWSWASPTSVGNTSSGTTDGSVQYKSGSGFAATNSFFYDTTLYALRLSNFPAGEATSSTSAALKVEQTTGSFNGSLNGTMIAVNANNGFTGDLLNLQTNANTKFRVDANGAIGTSSEIVSVSTTAATNTTSGALQVRGGAGIAQTLFVGGSISNTNYFYSGGNNYTKSGQAQGDIFLDNNSNDTPGLLYYYKNNTNFGIDAYAVGIGATRLRIVRDLNESTGAEIWSIDRSGVVTRSAWDVGEVINTRVYNNSDLGMSATTTINSTTYTNVAVITYTPKSSTSHLWIEFDANYDFSNGTTADDFFSRITVAGSVISERNQIMVGQVGGGTRSGVIFPISGRYTNSSTSGIAITVQARWGTADDAIRVYGSSTSGYMRIQEIGR